VAEIQALSSRLGLTCEADVAVGPYTAELLVTCFDRAGLQRNVRVLIEPRAWSAAVSARMAPHAKRQIERLKGLAGVDFVSIVVPGDARAPDPLTSLAELAEFLADFDPPSRTETTPDAIFRGWPHPTNGYVAETALGFGGWTGGGMIFCAMPFHPSFDPVFFDLIAPAVADAGLRVLRTDQADTLIEIDKRIRNGVAGADLVLADLTGHNANVMYELGVAHGLGKHTLLIHHDDRELPFDVKYHETMKYDRADLLSAKTALAERLKRGVSALWSR
jgi:hypothetical protein